MTDFRNKMPVIKTIRRRRRGASLTALWLIRTFFVAGPFCCQMKCLLCGGILGEARHRLQVCSWAKTLPMADGNMCEVSALFWVDLSLFFDKVEACLGWSARVCLSFSSPHPYPLIFFMQAVRLFGGWVFGKGIWVVFFVLFGVDGCVCTVIQMGVSYVLVSVKW